MEEMRTENPLGYEKMPKLLGRFAVPSIIAMLVSSLYNVVDQIFIGRGVGPLGNAATNVAFPLTTICMAIALTIGIGSAARFSLYLGEKKEDEAARVVGNGICMMALFGTLYAVLIELFLPLLLRTFGATDAIYGYAEEYTRITAIGMPFLIITNGTSNLARADGSPMYSMITMIIGAVINTILDPIFIFIFHMGVAGAAWATIIGQIISFLYAARYLRNFKRITLKRGHIRLSWRQMGKTATMGMSNGLTQLAITFVQIVINRSFVYYGTLSPYGAEIPLAAGGIVVKINSIVLAVIIGIIQGMQPIVGFNYGAGKLQRVKAVLFLAVKCELVITVIGFLVFQLIPRTVLSFFGNGDELYFEFGERFMRIFLLFLPLNGIQMISSNFFAAIGKPVKGTILTLTRQVFFLIPLVLLLPFIWGIDGIIYAAPTADFISFVVVTVFIAREIRLMNK